MTTEEILIRIRTAFESGGIDAARSELTKLTDQVKAQGSADAQAAMESAKLQQGMMRASAAIRGLTLATEGGIRGVSGLAVASQSLFSTLGQFGAVGAAIAIGAQLGRLADSMIQKFFAWKNAALDLAEKGFKALADRMQQLREQKLTELQDEFRDLAAAADEAQRAIDRAYQAAQRRRREEADVEQAKIREQMPAGPARDRALAAAELRAAQEAARAERQKIDADVNAAEARIADRQKKLSALQAEMDSARAHAVSVANTNRLYAAQGLMNDEDVTKAKEAAEKVRALESAMAEARKTATAENARDQQIVADAEEDRASVARRMDKAETDNRIARKEAESAEAEDRKRATAAASEAQRRQMALELEDRKQQIESQKRQEMAAEEAVQDARRKVAEQPRSITARRQLGEREQTLETQRGMTRDARAAADALQRRLIEGETDPAKLRRMQDEIERDMQSDPDRAALAGRAQSAASAAASARGMPPMRRFQRGRNVAREAESIEQEAQATLEDYDRRRADNLRAILDRLRKLRNDEDTLSGQIKFSPPS